MTGHVNSVWTKSTDRGEAPSQQSAIELVAGEGVVGDRHRGDPARAKRQVLLVGTDQLQDLGLDPGVLREQITVDFPGLQQLLPGTLLKIGSATVEITGDCAPCLTMAKYLGEEGTAFVDRAMRKRGMLGRVAEGGTVNPGDAVSIRGEAAN